MLFLAPFFKSILTGFTMCLPIGPISILVIRKTIRYSKRRALIPAFGSLTADIFYAAIVGFGITFIADFFKNYQHYIQPFGALVLLAIAIHILRKPTKTLREKPVGKLSFIKSFSTGFFLAIFNPGTLFMMTTILGALGIRLNNAHLPTSISIMAGLLIGELLWWLFLTNITELAKGKFGKHAPVKINKFAGIFLLAMSIIIFIKSIFWG